MFVLFSEINTGDQSVSLWTILVVLAIVALLVFIFRNVRR